MLKTRSIPIVEEIFSGFQSICSGKTDLTVYDMEGKLHNGKDIISRIRSNINEQNIKAIFTIGLPATQIINQSFDKLPIFYSMINDSEYNSLSSENISGISKNIRPELSFQYIKNSLPHAQKIAIIFSQENSKEKLSRYKMAAEKFQLKLNLYPVSSVKEVPKALRKVIVENDLLILIPDKMVINGSSLQYFVTTVLENGFPVLSYNNHLVKSGFLMGLVPDYTAMGEQAGELVCNNNKLPPVLHKNKHFKFSVNSKTVKTIRMKHSPDIIKLADYVY